MYIDYSEWESFEYSLNTLQLDLNNPRLSHNDESLNQTQIMKYLIMNESVYELAKKISEEGYFVGEEPIICLENGKKIVLEGNRRTAALKLLQNPKKYLSTAKSNILQRNILKNNFPVNKKLKCYIAPNRLLANPIIYTRHNGDTVKKWKTGNQYAFVADLYYEGALSIEDICDVLSETRAKILKPLKAYNLYFEGKDILEKEENMTLDISTFEFTNLERFYTYEPARNFLGIEFDNDNGELIINLPRGEFELRLLEVFNIIIDSERFSREFNDEKDKKQFVESLKKNSKFNFSVPLENNTKSKTSEKKSSLEEKKKDTTKRKRKKRKAVQYRIIQNDKEIIFDDEKLDSLFEELKSLPVDKVYSFAVLLRTYLEQSLYFFLKSNKLFENLSLKLNESNRRNSIRKVKSLIEYIKNKHSVDDEIDQDEVMNILKFSIDKDYSNASLKSMLDYVKNNHLENHLDAATLKNLNHYIDLIKQGLDLAVHNPHYIVNKEHNIRAWKHLEPLFDILSENINN